MKANNVIMLASTFDYQNDRSQLINNATQSIAMGSRMYNFYSTKDRIVPVAEGNSGEVAKWQGNLPRVSQDEWTGLPLLPAGVHSAFHNATFAKKVAQYILSPNPKNIPNSRSPAFKAKLLELNGKFPHVRLSWWT